ncbi:MAG TPA: 2-C-methyl-D-erythritol 4-phosphate cytidylyltransferase [Geobacteraceae bacterium]|nr:2-C-methyl-D-erythritol 4-phosphate cytidylyltransferase [Geobacteraceae bacterium]
MKTVALIPAAGMGKRMGAAINKQYLLLDDRPILAKTLQLFQDAEFIDEIYPIIPAEEIDFCQREVVERYGLDKVKRIITGGAERQNSVLNGLRALDGCDVDDIVVIHDGVRPFVPPAVIRRSVEMAMEHDSVVVAVPVKDTVKIISNGFAVETPPRETLWLAQTPQTFRYGVIRSAHELAEAEGFLGTDDASLLERLGDKVHVVIGDYRNIKITTPEDMLLAEAFLHSASSPSAKE